jgi:hypothetical protein
VALALPSGYVKFGDVVQLVAPDVPEHCRRRARGGGGEEGGEVGVALSGLIGEKEMGYGQHFMEGCVLTGSPFLTPCVRNSFVIRR